MTQLHVHKKTNHDERSSTSAKHYIASFEVTFAKDSSIEICISIYADSMDLALMGLKDTYPEAYCINIDTYTTSHKYYPEPAYKLYVDLLTQLNKV